MDATETADFYELVVARHHTSTVLTSNRGLDELPAMIRDAPVAAAVDRFTPPTHELVINS